MNKASKLQSKSVDIEDPRWSYGPCTKTSTSCPPLHYGQLDFYHKNSIVFSSTRTTRPIIQFLVFSPRFLSNQTECKPPKLNHLNKKRKSNPKTSKNKNPLKENWKIEKLRTRLNEQGERKKPERNSWSVSS